MARRRQPEGRKRRTREHIIADLSVNYLERKVLECGFVLERRVHDYGIDVTMITFDERGEVEVGQLDIQLKSTEELKTTATGKAVSQTIAVRDLKSWMYSSVPVILVVYDSTRDRAYWIHIQGYAQEHDLALDDSRTINLRIPLRNRVRMQTIRDWRELKNREYHEWLQWRSEYEN